MVFIVIYGARHSSVTRGDGVTLCRIPCTVPDRIPGTISDRISSTKPDRMSNVIPDRILSTGPDWIAGTTQDWTLNTGLESKYRDGPEPWVTRSFVFIQPS